MNAWMKCGACAVAMGSLVFSTGCGGTYQPSRQSGFNLDSTAEINDDDVRKAFDARPQLGSELHVAFYTFDQSKAVEIEETLKGLPNVSTVYRIPPLVVTGQRRLETENPWEPAKEISLKKLRLLAARSRCEVLIVVDRGYKTVGVNPLIGFSALLFPILFVPMVDSRVEGYAEAFVIDTRNGYLYGHVTKDDKRGEEYQNIYQKGGETLAEEQWQDLRRDLGKELARLILDEEKISRDVKAEPPHHEPAAPPAPKAP